MDTLLLLAVAVALPTVVGYAGVVAVRVHRRMLAARPPAPLPPVEQVGAHLRRLHADLERTERAVDLPAKNMRRNAVRAAYVDALSAACHRFNVPPPASVGATIPLTEIYRAEAALRRHGLDVRPTGVS